MNKQQRYLSLMMVVTAISAKGMELQTTDAPNQEDAPDKFAVLKPKLTTADRERLQYTINSLPQKPTRDEILEAYNAAITLEVDQTPDAREKDVLTSRKNLWAMLKEASADANAVQLVDYLTGSEDEQEDADETAKLNQLVARVHRRDRQLRDQAVYAKTQADLQDALKADDAKLTAQLESVNTKKQPLDTNMQEITAQESTLNDEQDKIAKTQEAIQRLVENSRWAVDAEPLLADKTEEQLQPVLRTELALQKEKLTVELGKLVVAKAALSQEISPLTTKIEQLTTEQKETQTKQTELAQLIEQAKTAQTLAQTDREKILVRIDQKIELAATQRETFKTEAAELAKQIAEEKDAEQKATLIASKKTKDGEIAGSIQTIQALKLARAQADNTYSYSRWLRGYYNGDN